MNLPQTQDDVNGLKEKGLGYQQTKFKKNKKKHEQNKPTIKPIETQCNVDVWN